MNFKNFGNEPSMEGRGRLPGNNLLARQSSVFSLTFDEFQSTMGAGIGKDFGSINMDELLKSIWSAEETQTMVWSNSVGQEGGVSNGHLQRQGSLTLPRTLSQKTVDEVWRDMAKESKDGIGGGVGGSIFPHRQPTLGEMTLEEFLARAGVVREDAQLQFPGKPNDNTGFFGELSRTGDNSALGIGFQQTDRNSGLTGNRVPEVINQTVLQSVNLPVNVRGVRSTQQRQRQQQQHQQQQQLFSIQPTFAYANPIPIPSSTQLKWFPDKTAPFCLQFLISAVCSLSGRRGSRWLKVLRIQGGEKTRRGSESHQKPHLFLRNPH